MEIILPILSYPAFVLVIASTWLTGQYDRRGWILGLISCALWIVFSLYTGNIPLLLQNACLGLFFIKNYLSWVPDKEMVSILTGISRSKIRQDNSK